jgi:hypothetical protein
MKEGQNCAWLRSHCPDFKPINKQVPCILAKFDNERPRMRPLASAAPKAILRKMIDATVLTDHPLFAAAAICALVAAYGIVRDRLHARRSNLDTVSLLPWGTISGAAMIAAIALLAIAIRRAP